MRLHRGPGHPRPRRGRPRHPGRRLAGAARARRAAIRVKIDVVVADLRETEGADGHPGREVSTTATRWPTPSSGPRTTRSGTARQSRWVRVRRGWRARPALWRPRLVERHHRGVRPGRPPTAYRRLLRGPARRDGVDKKARGSQKLRFVVLTDLAAPPCWRDRPRPTCAARTTSWREADDGGAEGAGPQRTQPGPARLRQPVYGDHPPSWPGGARRGAAGSASTSRCGRPTTRA